MVISINGKSGSGKDLVGAIIQYLIYKNNNPEYDIEFWIWNEYGIQEKTGWDIKKFADKTTESFYLITGINYHKLNREEKEKIRPKYIEFAEKQKEIFEEDVWVNALMSEYVIKKHSVGIDKYGHQTIVDKYPNWIITDMRFPNELKDVKDRGGISIRVNRDNCICDFKEAAYCNKKCRIDRNYKEHPSETALDNAEFDYTIDNNGTIEELIEKVKEILIKENII